LDYDIFYFIDYSIMVTEIDYFQRSEVSNSKLKKLDDLMNGREPLDNPEFYKFGSLHDAVITEEYKVNYLNLRVLDEQYTHEDFAKVKLMKESFFKDDFCCKLHKGSKFQHVSVNEIKIVYRGFEFTLDACCKWDGWKPPIGWELKSTVATTQKAFEELCIFFKYNRAGAWYMDIAGIDTYVMIGQSKKNPKLPPFRKIVRRGDDFYLSGKEEYQELAFKYWSLINNFGI
jgi:hypothetical protein